MPIEEVTARLWPGRSVSAEPIAAGLTNQNVRVVVDGTPYFVRIPGAKTDLLAVDRENELFNTRAAAESGVGAAVVAVDAATGAFALEWIDGRTMSNALFAADALAPQRIAASLRQLHAGPRFRDDFDMFRLTEFYVRVVDERGIRVPDGYRDELPKVALIEAALAAHPVATVPCHTDLLAENYILEGQRLRIVDYEYSGNNDPTFELGNTAQELGFDVARQEALCAAYFGEATPALMARMRLQMIMSDVGWTLWAAIQAAISTIDYDFWGWALERWGRASTAFAADSFDDLVAEAVAG
jgi:thiamine kinase-like enzyme